MTGAEIGDLILKVGLPTFLVATGWIYGWKWLIERAKVCGKCGALK